MIKASVLRNTYEVCNNDYWFSTLMRELESDMKEAAKKAESFTIKKSNPLQMKKYSKLFEDGGNNGVMERVRDILEKEGYILDYAYTYTDDGQNPLAVLTIGW